MIGDKRLTGNYNAMKTNYILDKQKITIKGGLTSIKYTFGKRKMKAKTKIKMALPKYNLNYNFNLLVRQQKSLKN